ncbi:MAG: DUF86 domain-containing protein [Candidatus Freyarchaeota archaeon]
MGELEERVEHIRKNVKGLDQLLREKEAQSVINDFTLLNATLHMLQTSIQSLIDASARLLSELGEKPPATYGELPEKLSKNKVLSHSESLTAKKVIGFRNIIVHTYLDLNTNIVLNILKERKYHDILKIALKILRYAHEKKIDP